VGPTSRERSTPKAAESGPRPVLTAENATERDDTTLVRFLVEGDSRGPRLVWQKFAPMVHRMLTRAFGPRYEIDDLAQEVFLTLFQRVHTLREPQALRAFVISITAYAIRYELRKKTARRWLTFGLSGHALTKDVATGVDLDSREALERFYGILDSLGSDDRTAFVLRFIEGLELEEVAAALGVSVATTKRRLLRARRRVLARARQDGALVDYVENLAPESQTGDEPLETQPLQQAWSE
jgi:RNA polymerase sigma-70 factor (ECF subfamily)